MTKRSEIKPSYAQTSPRPDAPVRRFRIEHPVRSCSADISTPKRTTVCRTLPGSHHAPTSSRVWEVARKIALWLDFSPWHRRVISVISKKRNPAAAMYNGTAAWWRALTPFFHYYLKHMMTVMTTRQPHAP